MCAFTNLEPDGSLNSVWNIVGGAASRHAAVNDESLTTGIDNPGTGSTQQFSLQTTTVTGGGGSSSSAQRIRGIRMRDISYKFDAQAYVQFSLWAAGASAGWTETRQRSASVPTDTFTSKWWHTKAPNSSAEWNQANLDGAQFRVWESSTDGAGRINVWEVNVEVEINSRPTVTAVTVTGETTTTSPSATYTYTQPDGYTQQRRDAKVFHSSVYNAPGFNPDSSTPVWSSSTFTAETSLTIETNLVDQQSYRLYVKAAMSWPLGDGYWWSDWAFDGFTINLTPPVPPPAPAVVRTVDTAAARTELAIAPALNWLDEQDASLENSANVGTWVNLANATLANSATQADHGTRSLRLTAVAGGNMSARTDGYGQGADRVYPGGTYAATIRFRAGTTGRSVRANIRWLDAAGALLSTTTGGSVTDNTTGFVTATVSGTAPANAKRWDVVAEVLSAAAAEQHYYDRNGFAPGSAITWSPGAADLTGTNAVTVVQYQDCAGPNLLDCNVADAGNSLGSVMGLSVPTTADRLETTTEDAWVGQRAILWAPSAAGSILDLGWSTANTNVNAAPLAAPGATMRAWVAVRAQAGTFDVRVRLRARDAAGAVTGTLAESSTISVGTSWTIVATTLYTATDTALWAEAAILNQGGTTSGVLLYGGGMLEITTSPVAPTEADWTAGTGDRGETWNYVRATGVDGYQPLTVADQRLVVYDYEARRGEAVRVYRAVSQTTYLDVVTASAPTYAVAWEPAGTDWRIKSPNHPALNRVYGFGRAGEVLVTGTEIPETVEVYEPADGSFPVAVGTFSGARGGQLSVGVQGGAERERLLALLGTSSLYLQMPGGGRGANRYIRTVGNRSVTPRRADFTAASYDVVDVPFIQTQAPPV